MSEEKLPEPENSEKSISWKEFLEQHPPDKVRCITDLGGHMQPIGPCFILNAPDLLLHCEVCGGNRIFHSGNSSSQLYYMQWQQCFLTYTCRNCRQTTKEYAFRCRWLWGRREKANPILVPATGSGRSVGIQMKRTGEFEVLENRMEAVKFGEWPPLGPLVSRKLAKLLGDDKQLFRQGRFAEGSGMGIGAFAYYRRMVENQRTAIFDKLIAAAERLKVAPEIIASLTDDKDNWQFSSSVDKLKAVLPDQLKVSGHSPLALLHNALSHNLHNESDAVCLDAARDIRIVLEHFAEQLDSVLKEQTELEKAVGRLTKSR